MLRRAKISVFFPLVGALTASAALLNPEQRNATFQPGATRVQPAVLRPAEATVANRLWSGVKVQRITPGPLTGAKVELSGVTFAKAGEAVVAPAAVKKAGGAR